MERVLRAIESISGARDKAFAWLQERLTRSTSVALLQNYYPAEGRDDDLLGYIQSFGSGYVG